jgi:hypothetical protein
MATANAQQTAGGNLSSAALDKIGQMVPADALEIVNLWYTGKKKFSTNTLVEVVVNHFNFLDGHIDFRLDDALLKQNKLESLLPCDGALCFLCKS